MNRSTALSALRTSTPEEPFDFLVIGGGATGLGTALDAASRGYKVGLVEQADFAKGTSSRSTKLVHGGVRYLKQGNISLVLEALHERGLLCANAPHIVHHLEFIVPTYSWWEGPFYGIGMKIYDQLAGKLGLHRSRLLSKEETIRRIPTIEQEGLLRGVSYYDGQFDDARLAIALAQSIGDHGGTACNYVEVTRFLKDASDIVCGAMALDKESGEEFPIHARGVINATGVFCDHLRQIDEPTAPPIIEASQGAHIVLPREFLPGSTAIMVPHTSDGRVLFAIPWHDRVVVGTTDHPVPNIELEPTAQEEEIDFILENAARYLAKPPTRADILSCYAGLRPLVKSGPGVSTAALSRDHTILISQSGLVTVTGGKWTTYRRMAQDTLDKAQPVAGFDPRPCVTENLRLHGWTDAWSKLPDSDDKDDSKDAAADETSKHTHFYTYNSGENADHIRVYGSDAPAIHALALTDSQLARPLHPRLPATGAEVVWAARNEMARTVEDFLSRRSRSLLLDAQASIEAAPEVARLLARELGYDSEWAAASTAAYIAVAKNYLPTLPSRA